MRVTKGAGDRCWRASTERRRETPSEQPSQHWTCAALDLPVHMAIACGREPREAGFLLPEQKAGGVECRLRPTWV